MAFDDGIKLHPRMGMISTAEAKLKIVFFDELKKHNLTYIEAMQAAVGIQTSLLRYALRAERHPEDPEKKADEA